MNTSRNLLGKGKLMLAHALLFTALFSCKKEDMQDMSVQGDSSTLPVVEASSSIADGTALSSNLLYRETFDGSTIWGDVSKQFGTSYAFTTSSNSVFSGSKAGRFELRDSDPMVSGGTRTEVVFPQQSNMNRWYSYAFYIPSADWQYDTKGDEISQWHQMGGVNPSISIRTVKDQMMLDYRSNPTSPTKVYFPLVKDKWQTLVLHIIHSHGSDGLIEIWQNGTKIFTHSGPNAYDWTTGTYEKPRWKMGIYKSDWNYSETTDSKKRVIYFDDVRMGNENAKLSDMTPTSGSTSTSTTSTSTSTSTTSTSTTSTSTTSTTSTSGQSVTSFTLINAATDQAIMTISDGASISLSTLGTSKLTIRANTYPSTVGSVNFTVSGALSRNATDSYAPYALFGDNKAGDFYYGTWNPPALGTYTLKATPYSSASAGGTVGTAKTITFSFVK